MPRFVQVHPSDNVAIIVDSEGLAAGATFANGLTLVDRIAQAHKVSLCDCEQGQPIIRYGQVIGHAARAIRAGSWIREDSVELPAAPALDELSLATAVPKPL